MQFRVIVVTDPQTNKHTDRGDYNTLHHSLVRSVINRLLVQILAAALSGAGCLYTRASVTEQ